MDSGVTLFMKPLGPKQIIELLNTRRAWTLKKRKVGGRWLVSFSVRGIGESAGCDAADVITFLCQESVGRRRAAMTTAEIVHGWRQVDKLEARLRARFQRPQ